MSMMEKLRSLFKTALSFNGLVQQTRISLDGHISNVEEKKTIEDLINYVYALRETTNLLDGMRKQLAKQMNELSRIGGEQLLRDILHEDNVVPPDEPEKKRFPDEKATTEWCSATPEAHWSYKLENRLQEPIIYAKILEWMGVPQELIEKKAVTIHYPGFSRLLTERQRDGDPIAKVMDPDRLIVSSSLSIRKRRELFED